MGLTEAEAKANRLLREKRRQERRRDLTDAFLEAVQPEFHRLTAVLRERLTANEEAIKKLELKAPDTVTVANRLRLDGPIEVTDPQLKKLAEGLDAVQSAIRRRDYPDEVKLRDGTTVSVDNIDFDDVTAALTAVAERLDEAKDSEVRLGLLTNNADPNYFIPVRLTDGSEFYSAKSIAAFVGGGGGSSDGLTDAELRAAPVDVTDASKQDALPYAEILTASATITPSSGTRIKLLKSQVLQSPANETYNVVTLNFTSLGDVVTGWAYSDSNEWVGAVDEVLNINLANANPVSVNIRYKEVA